MIELFAISLVPTAFGAISPAIIVSLAISSEVTAPFTILALVIELSASEVAIEILELQSKLCEPLITPVKPIVLAVSRAVAVAAFQLILHQIVLEKVLTPPIVWFPFVLTRFEGSLASPIVPVVILFALIFVI